jgi:hypothetical protein
MAKQKPIKPEDVRALAEIGFGQQTIAARLGVGFRTLVARIARDPAVKHAYEAGVLAHKNSRLKKPKKPVGRPPKFPQGAITGMDEQEKASVAIEVQKVMMARALAGDVQAARLVLGLIYRDK